MFQSETQPTFVPTFVEMGGSNERSYPRVEQPYGKIRVHWGRLGLGIFKRYPMEFQKSANSISSGEHLRE